MCFEFTAIASCTHGQLAKYYVVHRNEFLLVLVLFLFVCEDITNEFRLVSFGLTLVHSTKKILGIAVAGRRDPLAHGGKLVSYSP